jgi:hypothetical protein
MLAWAHTSLPVNDTNNELLVSINRLISSLFAGARSATLGALVTDVQTTKTNSTWARFTMVTAKAAIRHPNLRARKMIHARAIFTTALNSKNAFVATISDAAKGCKFCNFDLTVKYLRTHICTCIRLVLSAKLLLAAVSAWAPIMQLRHRPHFGQPLAQRWSRSLLSLTGIVRHGQHDESRQAHQRRSSTTLSFHPGPPLRVPKHHGSCGPGPPPNPS